MTLNCVLTSNEANVLVSLVNTCAAWLFVMNGRQRNTANAQIWGKLNDSNYDGNCTSRHCLSGTYEITGRLIFVEQCVHKLTHLASDIIGPYKLVSVYWIGSRRPLLTLFTNIRGSRTNKKTTKFFFNNIYNPRRNNHINLYTTFDSALVCTDC
jgi:hypothetical protein